MTPNAADPVKSFGLKVTMWSQRAATAGSSAMSSFGSLKHGRRRLQEASASPYKGVIFTFV